MNGIMVKLYAITDHTPNDVDNFKRFVAFAIDWFLGYLCIAAPVAVIWLNQTKNLEELAMNITELGNELGFTMALLAAILSIIAAILYFVIVPWKNDGQTIGKRVMGIKMVKIDGSPVDLKTICVRQILGIFIIEGYLCNVSEFVRQLLLLQGWDSVYMVVSFVAIGISAISIFVGYKFDSHRLIHDYLAKTKVINADTNA